MLQIALYNVWEFRQFLGPSETFHKALGSSANPDSALRPSEDMGKDLESSE